VSAEFRSNLGAFIGATERAIHSGLIAAAELYVTDMKQALEKGYTSGKFVTGNNVNAVARGEPETSGGGSEIAVGSRQTDPAYPLMWELGHHNQFTGRHERVEVWVPTMVAGREKYVAAMADEIRHVDGAL
jgi:hypothetical protein